jgi:GDP-4-dehydro-6-deoxy-D-mannose reductase
VRYLITGIGGFAGRHLATRLLDQGNEVVGLVHSPKSLPADLAARIPDEALAAGDVCDRKTVAGLVERTRPDGIFHLAGQSSVMHGEAAARDTFTVNTVGALQVLAVAARYPCRVVVVSSGECYGRAAGVNPVTESTPLRPVSVYAASKAAVELLVRHAIDAYGADALCARSFNHTGPGQSARFVCADFARQIVAVERGRQPAIRVGNLDAVRDFLDVRDVVRAYLCLWQHGEKDAMYNVASGVGRRIGDVLDALCRGSSVQPAIEPDPERLRPAEVPVLIGDNSRLRGLAWQPRVDWGTTLSSVLSDWRQRPS